jgi:hypothetical protein
VKIRNISISYNIGKSKQEITKQILRGILKSHKNESIRQQNEQFNGSSVSSDIWYSSIVSHKHVFVKIISS